MNKFPRRPINIKADLIRLAFDMYEGDQQIDGLIKDLTFQKTLLALTTRNLLFTQSIGFELKKNTSAGFPWHIGSQSFGYHRAEDFGCTIWTPLAPIDTRKQRGGMAYVPKDIRVSSCTTMSIPPCSSASKNVLMPVRKST
ncbi:hypothetical protein [Telmatospirillum sp.]|uniref:hypothetical protein n=1 Tax=Telmatospirillum sp. TaxID=2079197 RepID=UPI0028456154|nr:hypothetical protein [Telmatospirillum sp.]MDR3439473.1 hypothetical protein [Telmatospirillum sp.]